MVQNFTTRVRRMGLCVLVFIIGGHIQYAGARNTLDASDSLKYLGHAFVKIKTAQQKVIYIDPYAVNEFADSADIVLITHEHSDHNDLTRVKQKAGCLVIRSANAIIGGVYQSFTVGDIKITAVAAYNANHLKSSCVGYVVEFNGIKLYHAGDTGKITEMADLASQNITYALIPMDGMYTMSPEDATQAAAMIHASHDIPIHTMPPTDTYSDAIVARFTSPNKLIVRPGASIELSSTATSVEKPAIRPEGFRLNQNYPNPFNPTTTIAFSVGTHGYASLHVYDVLGREVAIIFSGELKAGSYTRQWNAAGMPSGIYCYTLQAGAYSETKKLILLK